MTDINAIEAVAEAWASSMKRAAKGKK